MRRSGLHYNPLVLKRLATWIGLLALTGAAGAGGAGTGCARDVNPPTPLVRYPAQINLGFRTRGSLEDNTWYYFVFNFTAAPSTAEATAPWDDLSTKDRGRNWELYVAYHRDPDTGAQFVTLQRPALPTVLTTAAGPTDAVVGDYNTDNINDIAVACRTAGVVQMIRGRPTEIYNTTYFENPEDIPQAAGPSPSLLLSGDVAGATAEDLLVFYDGDGTTPPFLRVLESDAAGGFTAGADLPLGGAPKDALLADLNGDGHLDLAVLTAGSGAGETALRIFAGDGAGAFTAGAVMGVGTNPVALSSGHLDAANVLDLAVADRGPGTGDGDVRLFFGAGDGTFTAGLVLAVPGPCGGMTVGKFFGATDDVVVTYFGTYRATPTGPDLQGGLAGVFLNEAEGGIQPTPIIAPLGNNPSAVRANYLVALDTGKDTYLDAVVLSGQPGSGGRLLYIQRGGRFTPTGTTDTQFVWQNDTISYITELEPSRLRLGDVDKNGVQDFVIPCPGGGTGTRLCIYYGLGRSNYTSADIYWTDQQPMLLGGQEWLLSPPSVGPNTLQLQIDPLLFYDLALQPPDARDGFIVDFMTGTTGIDLQDNLDHLGEIRDHLNSPVPVPMEPGTLIDEQQAPRANQYQAADPSQDIDYYSVEVI
jgi:hypothetical protein